MKLLALSGSTRIGSSNTALLKFAAKIAQVEIEVFDDLINLPIFSPDLEGDLTPNAISKLCYKIEIADGLIISSPEYVHAIPGPLKNAIDWLVQRDCVIGKPIALLHASHRGEDMLGALRLVLGTISDRFTPDIFARFPLVSLSEDDINNLMNQPENTQALSAFLSKFETAIAT